MPTEPIHLPNGYVFTVYPVFGGMTFRNNEINLSHSVLPPGWNVVIQTDKSPVAEDNSPSDSPSISPVSATPPPDFIHAPSSRSQSPALGCRRRHRGTLCRFTKPTMDRDSLFVSSMFLPPSSDFKPPTSPTRQIAMILWATLWWYFHLQEPNQQVTTSESALTPEPGRPKGDWRIYIRREGVLNGRNLMQKLERMGLVTTENSAVGLDPADPDYEEDFESMFVSRRSFWQMDPKIFLFTLEPASVPNGLESPHLSRPASPSGINPLTPAGPYTSEAALPGGPFRSGSHLPTYFPPAPQIYTLTNGVRHPVRPKAPRQGETFYVRYIRSVGKTLSFRVPILPARESLRLTDLRISHRRSASATSMFAELGSTGAVSPRAPENESDLDLIHRWMNNPRANAIWGAGGPRSTQEAFLRKKLTSRFSFPVIGCWDGKPFGYFEIYWVKESELSGLLTTPVANWDRGFRCLMDDEDCRSFHQVQIWLTALVHYCWLADNRTQNLILRPRVDDERMIANLTAVGFYKEGEVAFPNQQSAVMKINRDSWEAPVI